MKTFTQVVEKLAADWTEEERVALGRATADMLQLEARMALGEPVEQELAIADATIRNLGAAKAVAGSRIVWTWLDDRLVSLLRRM